MVVFTDRELQVWNEIKTWEQQLQAIEFTDFTAVYDKWVSLMIHKLPEETKNQFFLRLDNWLFHLHAFIQNSTSQQDARMQIIGAARVFNEDIEKIDDLKELTIDQLTYIANHHVAKHRLVSAVQGGLTGTGNSLFLGIDLMMMAIINLRITQLISMSYGFDSTSPFELMIALKVFYTATLPTRFQKHGWDMLVEEVINYDSTYFYEGNENFTDVKWLEEPAKQLVKSLAIIIAKRKLLKEFPIVGVAFGAGMNYKLTKQVSELAMKFYQFRYLLEKKESNHECN